MVPAFFLISNSAFEYRMLKRNMSAVVVRPCTQPYMRIVCQSHSKENVQI